MEHPEFKPQPATIYQPSPGARAAMLGDLFAGLIRHEDLDLSPDEAKVHLDEIWEDIPRFEIVARNGAALGVFSRSLVSVPDGFGDFKASYDGTVTILVEPSLELVTLSVDQNGNLSHAIAMPVTSPAVRELVVL